MEFTVADVMSVILAASTICGLVTFFATRRKNHHADGVLHGKTESRFENIDASLIAIREQLSVLPSLSEWLVATEIEQKAAWRRIDELRNDIEKLKGVAS